MHCGKRHAYSITSVARTISVGGYAKPERVCGPEIRYRSVWPFPENGQRLINIAMPIVRGVGPIRPAIIFVVVMATLLKHLHFR